MQDSKLGYQTWAIAVYLLNTGIKGTSSMKLHRDLGVTQRTAWHLAHRIRETWTDKTNTDRFEGPVEVDETYIGGLARNMHARDRKRRISGTGGKDKAVVAGVLDRRTGKITAQVVAYNDAATLVPFVTRHTHADTTLFTDEHRAYLRLPRNHYSVRHSVGEYVNGKTTAAMLSQTRCLRERRRHQRASALGMMAVPFGPEATGVCYRP